MKDAPVSPANLATCGPRRLPVYFILDFSSSVAPEFIAGATQQLREVLTQLQTLANANRPEYNRAPVFYTVIIFRTTAVQLQPLAPLEHYPLADLHLEEIRPHGAAGLESAWNAFNQSLTHELKMPGTDHGDYLPLAFIFTESLLNPNWPVFQQPPVPIRAFRCHNTPPADDNPAAARLISGHLPLACHPEILHQIETARDELKKRQLMIDYPTHY